MKFKTENGELYSSGLGCDWRRIITSKKLKIALPQEKSAYLEAMVKKLNSANDTEIGQLLKKVKDTLKEAAGVLRHEGLEEAKKLLVI